MGKTGHIPAYKKVLIFTYPGSSNRSAKHEWKDGQFSSLLASAETMGRKTRRVSSFLPDWMTGGKETGTAGVLVPPDRGFSAHAQSWPAPISLQYHGREPKRLNKRSLSARRISSGSMPSWCGHAISGQLSISSALARVFSADPRQPSFLPCSSSLSPQGFHLHIYKANRLSQFTMEIIFMMNKWKAAWKFKKPQSISPNVTQA